MTGGRTTRTPRLSFTHGLEDAVGLEARIFAKACPRCRGDVVLEHDDGPVARCLHCGMRRYEQALLPAGKEARPRRRVRAA